MSTPSDPKVYEYILFQHDPSKDMMLAALDIVRDFIIEQKLVITGGMAIDFALRLKGEKLYDDTTLPDYDFFSPDHHVHAYELGSILCKKLRDHRGDVPNISVIDALHITTMKVRVNFVVVADITYMPIDLFEKLSVLEYGIGDKNIKFRHPHLQMGDQHRALSMPYENTPYEVILHRWKKDMKRFDLLYKHYPIPGKLIEDDQYQPVNINLDILKESCICGFAGLYLLTRKPDQMANIEIKLPAGKPLVLLSDKTERLISEIMKAYSCKIKYFNSYLDVLPQKIVILCSKNDESSPLVETETKIDGSDTLEIHIYDTSHKLISAEKLDKCWLANAQYHLLYFNLMQSFDEKNAEIYRDGYHTLTHLVESGAKKPTHVTYGSLNIGLEHVLSRAQTLSQNKEIPRIKIALKPGRFYPSEENKCAINPTLSNFQYEESPLFQVDGEEVDKRPIKLTDFINPIRNDNSSGSDNEN